MKEIKTFHVPNIGCAGCVRTIQNEIAELNGVRNVIADLETKTVVVEWDDPATRSQVEARLAEIDYPAVDTQGIS
jgi:copper chaperone CopZ